MNYDDSLWERSKFGMQDWRETSFVLIPSEGWHAELAVGFGETTCPELLRFAGPRDVAKSIVSESPEVS
jgi:hypothetical protein